MIQLHFLTGDHAGQQRSLHQTRIGIGKPPECEVVLDLPDMPTVVATLELRDDQVFVTAMDSGYPVYVNERAVTECGLEAGDVVRMGEVQFRARYTPTPEPDHVRTWSVLDMFALGLVGLLIVAQLLFLGTATGSWRTSLDMEALRPTPTPEPLPTAVPTPMPTLDARPTKVPQATPTPKPTKPKPTPTLRPSPTPTPVPGVGTEDPQEMLALAQNWIEQKRYLDADRLLAQIQREHPGVLDTLMVRGRLFGERGMYREGIEQWKAFRAKVKSNPQLVALADREIGVLAGRQALIEGPLPTVGPTSTPVPFPTIIPAPKPTPTRLATVPPRPQSLERKVRIHTIDQDRFPAGSVYDEMRLLKILAQPGDGQAIPRAGRVQIEVQFYDRFANGAVAPSRLKDAKRLIVPTRTAKGFEADASYVVPRGEAANRGATYHGYRVRIYLDGTLQDVRAKPKSLTDR